MRSGAASVHRTHEHPLIGPEYGPIMDESQALMACTGSLVRSKDQCRPYELISGQRRICSSGIGSPGFPMALFEAPMWRMEDPRMLGAGLPLRFWRGLFCGIWYAMGFSGGLLRELHAVFLRLLDSGLVTGRHVIRPALLSSR